jgi:flavin-dependent dehydrogenase
MGVIPVCPPRRFVYDGLMLIGDAAGQATIWSCMGSEPALIAGQLAGQAAIEAQRRKDYSLATWKAISGNGIEPTAASTGRGHCWLPLVGDRVK